MQSIPAQDARRGFDPWLALMLVVALALRLREALRAPLWYDELYSLAAASRPLHDVLALARADVHPPLHFVLSWAWRVFGDSDLAVRSLSLLCGLAGIAAAYALAEALFGRAAARITALLLMLHPWHVYISQEARAYAPLWLALTLSALGAWRWSERGKRRDAALFVLAAAAALWTHYISGLVLAAQFAWGAVRLAREPRRLGQWAALHAAVALLFAPQVPTLWEQFHRVETDHWLPTPDLAALADLVRRLAYGGTLLAPVFLVLALLPFTRADQRRAAGFAWVVGPLAVFACWVLGTRGVRLFGVKYVLFTLPLVMALVAAGIARLPGRASAAVVTALLAVMGLRSLWLRPAQPEAAGFGGAKAFLAARAHAGDPVFHADTHTLLFAEHYFPRLRHRLLLEGQRLPYFEGGLLVPDSVRAEGTELFAAHARGARWFAMSSRPAGIDTRIASADFDSLAAGPAKRFGVVRVWDGAGR